MLLNFKVNIPTKNSVIGSVVLQKVLIKEHQKMSNLAVFLEKPIRLTEEIFTIRTEEMINGDIFSLNLPRCFILPSYTN